jgi:hypothetical protein
MIWINFINTLKIYLFNVVNNFQVMEFSNYYNFKTIMKSFALVALLLLLSSPHLSVPSKVFPTCALRFVVTLAADARHNGKDCQPSPWSLPTVLMVWIPNYLYPIVMDEDSDNPMFQNFCPVFGGFASESRTLPSTTQQQRVFSLEFSKVRP